MIRRHLRVAVFACGLVAVYAQAADKGGSTASGDHGGGTVTRSPSGPTADVLREHQAPLQTGEVQLPKGGLETGQFDPNAGAGFKGQSTPVGTVTAPAAGKGATGGTPGGTVEGAAGSKSPDADTGSKPQRKASPDKDKHSSNARGLDYESSLTPALRIR